MSRFSGAIAVVTGAGSGIGEATAKRFAEEGAKVILVGRTLEKLERVAAEINEQDEKSAFPFVCDVTEEKDVNLLKDYIVNDFKNLHILVNNAGGMENSTIQETTYSTWEQMQNVNLNSVFLVSKVLGKIMIDHPNQENMDRTIINVSSLSGHKPGAKFPHYSAAKASVLNLTRALAFEYGRFGIRVNSVSPGFVETPLIGDAMENERFMNAIKKRIVMQRLAKPEEIANTIAFLASNEASYITGTDLLVDGGYLLT